LGDPRKGLRSVLIAGTKGKGSTAAILTSIIGACGKRAGLFISPHLVEYRERIRIGLEPVSASEFGELAGKVAECVDRGENWERTGTPTAFETLTAMALLCFATREVDVAVLEVGMGGRLDATNVVTPDAACITPISLDHMDQLGNTVEAIAGEKAGIIKGPYPVISGFQLPAAARVIEQRCAFAGARLISAGKELIVQPNCLSMSGSVFSATTPGGDYRELELNLAGRHQLGNALVAIGAAEALGGAIGLTREALRAGLSRVVWPGRLQILKPTPMIVVDGAHNGDSARVLAESIRELFVHEKLYLVLGMLKGKDYEAVARELCPLADEVLIPRLNHPRAGSPEDLREVVLRHASSVRLCGDAKSCLDAAVRKCGSRDMVLVAGSLSLVGEVILAEREARRISES